MKQLIPPSTIIVPLPGAEISSQELVSRLLSDVFPEWGIEETNGMEDDLPAGVPWVLAAHIPQIKKLVFIWPEQLCDLPEEAWWVSTDIDNDLQDEFSECEFCLVIETTLEGTDPRFLYQQQLKVALALSGDAPFIYDDNAGKAILKVTAEGIVEMPIIPEAFEMFSMHALFDHKDNQRLWLHTHGLARAGISDIEMIGIKEDKRVIAAHLMSLAANRLMDKTVEVGSEMPVSPSLKVKLVTLESVLDEMQDTELGSIRDRDDFHIEDRIVINSVGQKKSSGEFSFLKKPLSSKNLDGLLENLEAEEIILQTTSEIARTSELAQYRWPIFIALYRDRLEWNWEFFIKAAFTDKSKITEHLWFEIKSLEKGFVMAKLVSKPVQSISLLLGTTVEIELDAISDWNISTDDGTYDPSTVSRLASQRGVLSITPKPVH